MKTYDAHPAADVFPLMSGPEYAALVDDVKRRGLIESIKRVRVGRELLVLDGRNRLRACKDAGVAPRFEDVDGKDPVAYVISANLHRRHLNGSQRAMVAARIANLGHGGDRSSGRSAACSQGDAAVLVGTSERSVRSARAVVERAVPEVVRAVERGALAVDAAVELAKLPQAQQREIAERVGLGDAKEVRPGHVRAFARQAAKAEVARQLDAAQPAMPTGPFHVIVSDPPWPYEKREGDATHRGDLPYPPMSIDAICALPVQQIAHDDGCVLWLWTTNAFMRDAYRVLDAWGFTEKTILTWAKNKIGLGDWLRGKTEHAILAVRGRPVVTLTNETTLLEGEVREHSRKPESFYELVERLCHGSKVEMFCRTPRPGWARWGAESEKFTAA